MEEQPLPGGGNVSCPAGGMPGPDPSPVPGLLPRPLPELFPQVPQSAGGRALPSQVVTWSSPSPGRDKSTYWKKLLFASSDGNEEGGPVLAVHLQ